MPTWERDEIWYHKVKELLKDFRRDVTILVYTINSLRKAPTWHSLGLASEARRWLRDAEADI